MANPGDKLIPEHLQGRRVEAAAQPSATLPLGAEEGATWRGWALGLICVTAISLVIPYFDFVLRGTTLSNNMFPAGAVFFLFVLTGAVTLTLAKFQSRLGLTRQDLVLVFCMTMVVNAIPGCGYFTFWVAEVSGGFHYATPENNYAKMVLPHVPSFWSPHDTNTSRPLEWFYTGLPQGESIPWGAWAGPYALWSGALLMMFGAIFALCGLLRRQWSEHEQLSFPLAQLPEDMVAGLDGSGPGPFLKDRMALCGIAIVFLFHSYNNLADYYSNIPRIPQGKWMNEYLTEPPWNGLNPVACMIYPSVIGLTYLISLEVSFSLWFFFIVSRVSAMFFIQAGLLTSERTYWNSPYMEMGTGALVALSLGVLYTARKELGGSFLEAIGARKREYDPGEVTPRFWWTLLAVCVVGSIAWMMWSGIHFVYAAMILMIILIAMIGMTRLTCEGGLFFMQMYVFPVHFLGMVQTPAVMGTSQFVKLAIWDRVMVADWYRVVFMPNVMTTMHLSGRTALRRRTLVAGLALAVVTSLGVTFYSHLRTAYRNPGGASQMAWYYQSFPRGEYDKMSNMASQIAAFEQKQKKAEAEGREVPESEYPIAARRDWTQIGWIVAGTVLMTAAISIRKFLFWFPHPIGFVFWMGPYPLVCLWFSFFLGWAVKLMIVKFGGARTYMTTKRFFIGLVVGEACATLFWKLIAAWMNNTNSYFMLPT
ncbi:MAG: hypothetical protein KIS92_10470 [Planctomycetota bacterium]|nr:hypothetical protein [Planctomycetota bacterium]